MEVVSLTKEVLEERLQEARRSYKLNAGYAGLAQLPAGFVDLVRKHNPHIMELELSSNNLTELPDDMEEFRYLRTLRVKYNQLKRMPPVVGRLLQLTVLDLSGNQISKLDDSIGGLSWLKDVDLSGNIIVDLPQSICNLSKLEVLQLENNRIDALPEDIGDLPNLTRLDASTNNLRALPVSMGRLKKIQRIDVTNNMLARVPPAMGHLKTLKELNLRYNNLDDKYKQKTEEGLSRFLAFLREEEERERQEEIERLKPIGTTVGAYMEYRCKAEVGQVLKADHGEVAVDNRCWIRSGHSLTQVGNMLYIFGGMVTKDGSTSNELFWMTTDRMEWHNQPCKGERPCPRYNHTAVYDDEGHQLVVFGGRSGERKRLNDVYLLDLDSWVWSKVSLTDGNPPSPREQAAGAYWAGSLVLFGGHAAGTRTNDLFLLDLSTRSWSQPGTSGTAPSPRQASGMCVHANSLFVHGGRNNFVLEDIFVLDFMTKTWTEISTGGRAPPPRHSHLLTVHNECLYLFGGQDQLGAQSFSMYRLPLPPPEQYLTAKMEWQEWDCELPYNKCRTAICSQGKLSIYQLGSTTLGRAGDEETEKGLVWWDVFKVARLDGLKQKALDEDALRPRNAKRLRVEHTINIAGKMPKPFQGHSAKEQNIVAYVQDFQRVFEELYPHRRPLFLVPKNECNIPKFVCTTIRPTQMVYTELYDLPGCVQFVADFLAYEPLENPLHPPEVLPSPMSVLGWQAGDSFDVSVTLCSLLLGVGYNAYVVVGYAPEAMTMDDQTRTVCTVLEAEQQAANAAASSKVAKKADSDHKPKYAVKPTVKIESKILAAKELGEVGAQHETAEQADAEGSVQAVDSGAYQSSSNGHKDPLHNRRIHAWVLVMPGKRDVTDAIFVEPSTGRRYPVAKSPYLGIEFLWNDHNFWVCVQMPEPHSDSRADPAAISYDFHDPSKWQAVLDDPEALRLHVEAGGDERDLRMLEGRSGMPKNTFKPRTPSAAASGNLSSHQTVAASRTTRKQVAVPGVAETGRLSDMVSPPRTADAPDDADELVEPEIIDMPPSWVPKLCIPRDVFDMRCPRGSKLTLYHKAQHELFAHFGDCSRWDGMVERLILYMDDERTAVTEIRERFQRRKDKLRERRTYLTQDTTVEYFDAGSTFGLKDMLTIKGEKRIINFYHSARLDGLMQRVELMGQKIVETFCNRDDFLVYRSGTYVLQEPSQETEEEADERHTVRLKERGKDRVLPLRKMAEKFLRNPALDADSDIARRVFHVVDGAIVVDYHYGDGRITHSSRNFSKDGRSHIVQVDPLAEKPKASALLEQYQELLSAERDCMQAIRDSEWEVKEVLRTRVNQEQNIVLESPYYDIVRIKAEGSDEEEEVHQEAAYDYLSPFLPPLAGAGPLPREQALEVREKCLKSLKDRLIERANIIQARLDEESASLAKRHANFQRDREQISRDEEDEYERACQESMFRIHILEKRLKRHEEQALQKYYDLDHKLRSDPRMMVLLRPAMF